MAYKFYKMVFDIDNENTDVDLPDAVPKRLIFKNRGAIREFDVEFRVFERGKTLRATEIGVTKRKVGVIGEPNEDFDVMLNTLISRIEKALSIEYMQPDGYFKGDKAIGYIDYNFERDILEVFIDGKPYTWEELEHSVSAYEGFQIKIEFADIVDELE